MKNVLFNLSIVIILALTSCGKTEVTPEPTDNTCHNQNIYGKYRSLGNGDTIEIKDKIYNYNNTNGYGWQKNPNNSEVFPYYAQYEYCAKSNNTMSITYVGPLKIYFLNADIVPYHLNQDTLVIGAPTTNYQVYSLKNIASTKFVKI